MKGKVELLSHLDSLVHLAGRAARESSLQAAEQTAAYARQVVPVRTGRLKASIAAGEEGEKGRVRAICPYAAYVEMGTRFMTARPYLRPGVQRAEYPKLAARAWKERLK